LAETPSPLTVLSASLFHCDFLLSLARSALDRCREVEAAGGGITRRLPRDALTAILLAAAASEAFINEFTEETANYVKEQPSAHERVRLLAWTLQKLEQKRSATGDKFEWAARILSDSAPDWGGPPFQDFAILVGLRNDIMHVKRKSWIDYQPPGRSSPVPNGVKTLIDRGLADPEWAGRQTHWMFALMTPAVAEWACATCVAACTHICGLTPDATLVARMPRFSRIDRDKGASAE
jgi:hypothetical protein